MKLGRKEKGDTIVKGDGDADSPTGNGTTTVLDLDAPEFPTNPRPRHASGTEPFGALLVRRGLVSEEDVAQALIVQAETGKRLGETLVEMGALNQRELCSSWPTSCTCRWSTSVTTIRSRRRSPSFRSRSCGRAWPCPSGSMTTGSWWRSRTSRPSRFAHCSSQSSDHPIRFVLAPESDIQWAIDSSYRAIGGVDTLVEAFEAVEGLPETHDRHGRDRGRRRRRAHRAGRHPHPDPGQAGPRLGRAHRAVPGRRQGSLPH